MQYLSYFLSKTIHSIPIWPEKLYLNDYEWKRITDIHNWTYKDNHEYETTMFFIDEDSVLTPINRGSNEKVITRHEAEVKYKYDEKTKTYMKEMYTDQQLVRTKMVKADEMPKALSINALFSLHTHPVQGTKYSFFSSTDVNSLLASDFPCIGLITDKFWLLCKTDKSLNVLEKKEEEVLHEITNQIFFNPKAIIEELTKPFLKKTSLVLYKADFKNTLKLINI